MVEHKSKILITGGSGLVGTALHKILKGKNTIFLSSSNGDLRKEEITHNLFKKYAPKLCIHLAARVGGLKANMDYMAEFYHDNIMINSNVLHAAKECGVEKLVSVLSSCIYPKEVKYPITEEQLHLGLPHESNYGYSYAKRMVHIESMAYRKQYNCNFICAISNNLYGINDQFDEEGSHVIPAIIRKVFLAKLNNDKEVVFWGNGGVALREFTYSEDFAKALLFLMAKYDGEEPLNVGNTKEYSIKQIIDKVIRIIGYKGKVEWDTSKPDGQLRKSTSNKKFLKLGWSQKEYTDIDVGLEKTIRWFIANYNKKGTIRGINDK